MFFNKFQEIAQKNGAKSGKISGASLQKVGDELVASGLLVKNTLLDDFKAVNPGKSDAEINVANLPFKNAPPSYVNFNTIKPTDDFDQLLRENC